jgi:hypothetical protein
VDHQCQRQLARQFAGAGNDVVMRLRIKIAGVEGRRIDRVEQLLDLLHMDLDQGRMHDRMDSMLGHGKSIEQRSTPS